MTTCIEQKIRQAASLSTALQAFFGPPSAFRWYDIQMVQGSALPAAVVQGISKLPTYRRVASGGEPRLSLEAERVQVTVRHTDPVQARAAAEAVVQFMDVTDFTGAGQQPANFLLNQRSGIDVQLEPHPYTETLDFRIWNNLES